MRLIALIAALSSSLFMGARAFPTANLENPAATMGLQSRLPLSRFRFDGAAALDNDYSVAERRRKRTLQLSAEQMFGSSESSSTPKRSAIPSPLDTQSSGRHSRSAQSAVRASSAAASSAAGRSRQCYFSPVQCVLYAPMQQIDGPVAQLELVRPVLRPSGGAASRKRQTPQQRSNNLLRRWRTADSLRVRI